MVQAGSEAERARWLGALQQAAAGTFVGKEVRKAERAHSAAQAQQRAQVPSESAVATMSLREMKDLLQRNGIDFSHCVEKDDFRALATECLTSKKT